MIGTYNGWLVLCSVLVAIFASDTALGLSARVARAKAEENVTGWLIGGALAMGAGIWSMHFLGMLAFSLPIPLAYNFAITAASLMIAVVISGFALSVAASPEIAVGHLAVAALIMGAGISAMHYSGMAAIEIEPMITYEPGLVAASVAIAVAASFAALWLFFQLRHEGSLATRLARLGGAFVMGLAISGMHYTAMAASRFSTNSICRGGANIDNRWLAITIAAIAVSVLTLATAFLGYDGRSRKSAPANRAIRRLR
jgi:NO-binding membrane sensor protein with MHYT domain